MGASKRVAWGLARSCAFILACAVLVVASSASSDVLDGKWKQSALREDFTVRNWVGSCGPAPVSGSSGGGESVTIHVEGDELSFVGGGRTYNSRDCYEQMPTLARESHSHDPAARTWRTRCTTPPNDPRHAAMNTLVQVTSDTHIQMTETGRYEIGTVSTAGNCIADVTRTRTFDLVQADTPAPAPTPTPTPAPTPTPTAPSQCGSPGEPAQLEVRPSRKIMRQGESFAFHAVVADARGCATRTSTTWSADDASKGVAVDSSGKVTVAPDAPEGSVELTIAAAGKTTKVTVEVSSSSHYDTLLAQSGLNASGESDSASTVSIVSGSIGGGEGKGDDGAKQRKAIFIAIVVGVAAILGVVALFGWRRSQRAAMLAREAELRHEERVREVEERRVARKIEHDAQLAAHEESKRKAAEHAEKVRRASEAPAAGTVCPSCRREFSIQGFCPHDGNRLVPMNAASLAPGPSGNVCPTCRRGFDPGVKVCPNDGDELVPHAMLPTAAPAPIAKTKGKICPTCGGRFGAEATFCGKDGTALVLLN